MKELNKEILLEIDGGLNISGSLLSSYTKAIKPILYVGRSLGTAIRRISSGNLC